MKSNISFILLILNDNVCDVRTNKPKFETLQFILLMIGFTFHQEILIYIVFESFISLYLPKVFVSLELNLGYNIGCCQYNNPEI